MVHFLFQNWPAVVSTEKKSFLLFNKFKGVDIRPGLKADSWLIYHFDTLFLSNFIFCFSRGTGDVAGALDFRVWIPVSGMLGGSCWAVLAFSHIHHSSGEPRHSQFESLIRMHFLIGEIVIHSKSA